MGDLNTLPDPRYSSPIQELSNRSVSESGPYPDLSNEVAALSTKLINAINHQTNLDDNLQSTRHELVAARKKILELEGKVTQHEEQVSRGVLVKRVDTDAALARIRTSLAEEKRLRSTAETQKKGVEQEIENLTASLFEEANNMVASARRENEQLRGQLKDSETIRAVLQEQLQDLKVVMERLQEENDLHDTNTTPVTPTFQSFDGTSRTSNEHNRSPRAPTHPSAIADQPLKLINLIRPVLREDLPAFEEFVTLVRSSRQQSAPTSRNTTFGSLNMGLTNTSQSNITTSSQYALPQTPTSSSHGISTPNPAASPTPLSLPGSFNPSSPSLNLDTAPSLEKSKLYKRLLSEDIDPTLRLDAAPSLSFFARRTVVNSMVSGTLLVEPWPPGSRFYRPSDSCALCGEVRRDGLHVRRHRFRTSENEDAARYPLCDYCLERVRAACDLVGFLRLARSGHLKAETSDEARGAWEECVKLRERMFWARVGGGVIPAGASAAAMASEARKSADMLRAERESRESREESPEVEGGAMEPRDVTFGGRPQEKEVQEVEVGGQTIVLTKQDSVEDDAFSTPTDEEVKVPGGFDPSA
jgi:hypothetical protein